MNFVFPCCDNFCSNYNCYYESSVVACGAAGAITHLWRFRFI